MDKESRLKDGVELISLPDGSGLLVDGGEETSFTLNATGAAICKGLQEGATDHEIVQMISEEYGVTTVEVSDDLAELIASMRVHGLAV